MEKSKVNFKDSEKLSLLAVLGSGGHTTEMLKLVQALNDEKYTPKTFVYAKTDFISPEKLKNLNTTDFDVSLYLDRF